MVSLHSLLAFWFLKLKSMQMQRLQKRNSGVSFNDTLLNYQLRGFFLYSETYRKTTIRLFTQSKTHEAHHLIRFHNLGNIADGKLSRFLFRTRSNWYDFVPFGSARDWNIFWKEEGWSSLQYQCINVITLRLYVSSRLRTFSFENNEFECALKALLFTALIDYCYEDDIFHRFERIQSI